MKIIKPNENKLLGWFVVNKTGSIGVVSPETGVLGSHITAKEAVDTLNEMAIELQSLHEQVEKLKHGIEEAIEKMEGVLSAKSLKNEIIIGVEWSLDKIKEHVSKYIDLDPEMNMREKQRALGMITSSEVIELSEGLAQLAKDSLEKGS